MGEPSQPITQNARFSTTQWTQVLQACEGGDDALAQQALTNLCLNYWYPLYAYVRRKGAQPADAEDQAQGFLAQLLEKNRLAGVHPCKGKFRTFLLTCFDNYLRDQRDYENAKKRGGGQTIFSLDWESAEARYAYEPIDHRTPEYFYERAWAFEVLTRTLRHLREQCEEAGKAGQFEALKVFLTGDSEYGGVREAAAALGLSEGATRVAVTRLRDQYRRLLREEIAETVSGDREVEEEYRHVAEILREG